MNRYCRITLFIVMLVYAIVSMWSAFTGTSFASNLFKSQLMLSLGVFSFLLLLFTIVTTRRVKLGNIFLCAGVSLLMLSAMFYEQFVLASYILILVAVFYSCLVSIFKLSKC